jgi:hypothetical protein
MMKLPTREEKTQMIADAVAKITEGVMVEVIDASGAAYAVCIGDFREVGWVEKVTTRDSMCWKWTGPNPVKVDGVVINSGECTKEIEMDWS